MKMNPGEGVVHGADSAERIHRNQPSQRRPGYSYKKSFEIRLDEIDNGHLHNTKYLEYCSHTRYCQLVERAGTCAAWASAASARYHWPTRSTTGPRYGGAT
jgi:acyl-ACP thioesterase